MERADFDTFFRQEHPRILALAVVLTRNAEAARDLTQEAFLRAYRNWDRVCGLDAPGAWVRRALINLSTDRHRRLYNEARTIEKLHTAPAHAAEDATDQWPDAVRDLPTRQRAVVALYYVDDRSVSQIAELLRIREGTVKATLSAARANLRTALERTPAHD
jgi:RNA polymerase sigma-70 factor (ECF subfamily)